VIHTFRLVFAGATRWTLVITLTATRRAAAAITLLALWAFRTVTTLTRRAAFTGLTGGVLTRFVLMRTLVRMDRGGVVFFRMAMLFGGRMSRFLLFASTNDAFQAGFKAAE
jgi:hypothetical protein